MSVKYPILITEDPIEGGYTVSIPDLPGCITCCQTMARYSDDDRGRKTCLDNGGTGREHPDPETRNNNTWRYEKCLMILDLTVASMISVV